jgi:hypothetical protein
MEFSLKFWIGIILLVTNQPLGWGAMLVCSALAVKTKKKFFYFLGVGAYALSWGMLGLGFLLAGPEGIQYSRNLLKGLWMSPVGKVSVVFGVALLLTLAYVLLRRKRHKKGISSASNG